MVLVAFLLSGAALLVSGISVAVHIAIHNSMFSREQILKEKLAIQRRNIELLEDLHKREEEYLNLLKKVQMSEEIESD